MAKLNNEKTEQDWYGLWEQSGYFRAIPESLKSPYSILMPPPNLTGEPHAGHTIQHLIMDALARFKRMQGFDVLFQPGVDHAGIQFEGTLNKLLSKEGLTKEILGREEWMKKAWQFKDEIYKSFHKTWRAMGITADWEREVFTLDPKVQKAVLEEFKTFWDQDLLYKGAYIVQWCPKDQTAIEDLEMEYEERKEKLYFVKYKIEGTRDEYITIATARPETIWADTAIAIYPKHPKYQKYVGKKAHIPLPTSRSTPIPIIEDSRVDENFGTGALKITPGHDPLDYQIGKDHNLSISHAIDKTGKMTSTAGHRDQSWPSDSGTLYRGQEGLSILEARNYTVSWLKDNNAIEKEEVYIHSVPVCERCKTVVEPLISEEWFVKMKPLARKALESISKVSFIPKNFEKVIAEWLKEIHDWSISRSLWWGHRIPVWYCQKCNPNHLVGKDEHSSSSNKDMVISLTHPKQNCQTCQLNRWVQDEQILDTWFSSGLWPLATLGWPDGTLELKKYYPFDFEISAPDIKFLWIARMIMLGLWFKNDIPFKNMFFTGTLRDLQGRKFSKSLGNGVFPLPLIESWGVDAYRMAIFSFTAPARDGRASNQTLNERCKNYRNFGTKLRNIARFILMYYQNSEAPASLIDLKSEHTHSHPELVSGSTHKMLKQVQHDSDKAILEKLDKLVQEVTNDLESFNLHLATEKLYEFIWHEFADKYIESSKDEPGSSLNRRAEAQPTLEYVFRTSLELLHPFMPFITEELWQKLPHEGKSIMVTKWPKTF